MEQDSRSRNNRARTVMVPSAHMQLSKRYSINTKFVVNSSKYELIEEKKPVAALPVHRSAEKRSSFRKSRSFVHVPNWELLNVDQNYLKDLEDLIDNDKSIKEVEKQSPKVNEKQVEVVFEKDNVGNNKISSATLPELLKFVVSPESDSSFLKALLTTQNYYTNPGTLVSSLFKL